MALLEELASNRPSTQWSDNQIEFKIADDPRMLRVSAAVADKINRVQSIKGFAVNVNTGSPNSLRSRVLVRARSLICV